jgi:hypothetical protein
MVRVDGKVRNKRYRRTNFLQGFEEWWKGFKEANSDITDEDYRTAFITCFFSGASYAIARICQDNSPEPLMEEEMESIFQKALEESLKEKN